MTARGIYVVTGADAAHPYAVTIEPRAGGWEVVVRRDSESWTFSLEPGPEPGQVRVGDRPVVHDWEPLPGGRGRLTLAAASHELRVEREAAHRLAGAAPEGERTARAREVRSPMPGLVIAVEVEEGAQVESGTALIIVEAMKMENEITAPVAGVVRDLSVGRGEAVERGVLLCRIEPPGER